MMVQWKQLQQILQRGDKDYDGALAFLSLLQNSVKKNSLRTILTLLSVNYLSTDFFSKVAMLEMQQQ